MQLIGVHTILGLSAYIDPADRPGHDGPGRASSAIGAYIAGMLTVLSGWHHRAGDAGWRRAVAGPSPAMVGFPALTGQGPDASWSRRSPSASSCACSGSTSTIRSPRATFKVGPLGGEGFKQIRFFPENGWTTGEVALFIWVIVVVIDHGRPVVDGPVSRMGAVLRAVGEDDLAAQSVGINLTAVKVSAFAMGGFIAGDRRRDLRPLHDPYRAPQFRRGARHLRHRLSRSWAGSRTCSAPCSRCIFIQGISGRRPSFHGRLAQHSVRRADPAGDEPAPGRPDRCALGP